jgi:hypothetical protein
MTIKKVTRKNQKIKMNKKGFSKIQKIGIGSLLGVISFVIMSFGASTNNLWLSSGCNFCILDNIMEITILIKILVAAIVFGSMFFIKNKYRWIVSLILTAYLILIGAKLI